MCSENNTIFVNAIEKQFYQFASHLSLRYQGDYVVLFSD